MAGAEGSVTDYPEPCPVCGAPAGESCLPGCESQHVVYPTTLAAEDYE